jgi:hypothetical protein
MDHYRRYEWQLVAVGVVGLGLTVALAGPGEYSVTLGTLGFDPFYFVAGCFALLLCSSSYTLWATSRSD